MATAVRFTKEEFEQFILPQGFQLITLPKTQEFVYAKIVKHQDIPLSLRIYSSIHIHSEATRGVGEDAIRVMLFRRKPDQTIVKVGGDKRVHRVTGWRNNLQNRIDKWNDTIGPICGLCGAPTILRKPNKNQNWTPFFGCSNFPDCKVTAPKEQLK